jgi:hypothetical protein
MSRPPDDHLHVPMRQVPGGRWALTWLVTGVLFVGGVVGLEMGVRAHGYKPSINEDAYSWALERPRASDRSHKTVAILGASRILLAFSASAFREQLPDRTFVQLAYQSTAPVGSLRDLALDTDFRGIALVDITEPQFWPTNWHVQDDLISAYHRGWRASGQLAERWLTTRVQAKLAVLAVDGLRILGSLVEDGTLPPPPYTTTYPDRTKFADYDLVDAERKRRIRLQRLPGSPTPADPEQWLAYALSQELFVTLIESRGGKVVYVRMPTCDQRWATDEARMPKAQFWDRLARLSRATMIHFKDYPSLSRFECPDTSHIDSKDGPAFTRALIDILVERGVVTRSS